MTRRVKVLFGTYFVMPDDALRYDEKDLGIVEISPRVFTYSEFGRTGLTFGDLVNGWVKAANNFENVKFLNIHGPYFGVRFDPEIWMKVVEGMSKIHEAATSNDVDAMVILYPRIRSRDELDVLERLLRVLTEKYELPVSLRPNLWYVSINSPFTLDDILSVAKKHNVGVEFDVEDLFLWARLIESSYRKAFERVLEWVKEIAEHNRNYAEIPYVSARVSPFVVYGHRKIMLPWEERKESDFPIEDQIEAILEGVRYAAMDTGVVYNSTKDSPSKRVRIVKELKVVAKKILVSAHA